MKTGIHKFCFALLTTSLLLVSSAGVWAADTSGDTPSESYYQNREKGWFWYEDPPPPPKEEKEEKPIAPPPAVAIPKTPDEIMAVKFEAYKKTLEMAQMAAFLEPTPANLKRYAELQVALVKRASEASDVWQRVIWANPQLDFTQENPVTHLGMTAHEESIKKAKRETFDRLAATSMLYFFFRSDCPYCHEFAPILANFSKETGIRVFPITLDGKGLPEFPKPYVNNGIAATLGVTSWPALFLVEPAKGVITPVSYGVMSSIELADRLEEIANPSSTAVGAATPTQSFTPAALK